MADLGKSTIRGDFIVIGNSTFNGQILYATEKVGIGIKTPLESLDVLGNIKVSGSIRTSATTLNFQDIGGGYIGTKASSMVLASGAESITAPSNGAYIQGNVGIGINPSYKLDVLGDVRLSGQLRSTISTGTPPMSITSSTLVSNLNVDKLDNYEAYDIFNSVAAISGHGVVSGLEVSAVESTNKISVES